MLLRDLLTNITPRRIDGPADVEVRSISYDSRTTRPEALFVALRGERADGHDYIAQAIAQGAAAVIVDRGEAAVSGATRVEVEDSRAAMADVAAAFYRQPSLKLKLAGVTGTNGKTTTTFLIKYICERANLPCGLIGTVRHEIGGEILTSSRTTPEAADLQEMFARMRLAGCKAAAMEVSSHALSLDRVRGVEFDAAVFTNLTQDHLDFHRDMRSYFEAKASLFTGHLPQQAKKRGTAVINVDDRHGAQLLGRLPKDAQVITYGVNVKSDFRASNFKTELGGTSFQLDAQGRSFLVRLPLIGRFNIYNALAALGAACAMQIPLRVAILALATAPAVPGRLEMVPAKRNYQVYVDYAHTDDALINVLKTLRELRPNRLLVVFGCGGNRDRAKRPLMGRAADQLSDYAIVTSDNPRREDPAEIIHDIETGFSGRNYEVIIDRREAIYRAISLASARDIVLIAGKGHETYQEFGDTILPFDDVQVAQEAMDARTVEL